MRTTTDKPAALDAMRATNDNATAIIRGFVDTMKATNAMLEKAAARHERAPRPERTKIEPPPPVAALLHDFARALAAKVDAVAAQLAPDQRARLRAIVPGFTCAVLANEPDVVELVNTALAYPPDVLAFFITFSLPTLERRFAS